MKIALIGYGKMGQMVEEIALERKHEIVLRINIENVGDFTRENCAKADVAIEFTGPGTAYANIMKCIDYNLPVVSGSTGWNEKIEEVEAYCRAQKGSLLHTSNFSIGVNLFFELNKYLVSLMKNHPEYDVSMKEIHHTQKKDAPSGTAVTLAEQLLAALPSKKQWVNQPSQNRSDLPIISERIDAVPGIHEVKYTSAIDDIEIVHTAHNRKGFALGAVMAAEYIHDKEGVFTMKEVLGL